MVEQRLFGERRVALGLDKIKGGHPKVVGAKAGGGAKKLTLEMVDTTTTVSAAPPLPAGEYVLAEEPSEGRSPSSNNSSDEGSSVDEEPAKARPSSAKKAEREKEKEKKKAEKEKKASSNRKRKEAKIMVKEALNDGRSMADASLSLHCDRRDKQIHKSNPQPPPLLTSPGLTG